jgi:Rieske [2Fe-2S] domain
VVPFDIVDKSCLLVRTGEVYCKAFHNACLHRGRKLRASPAKGLDEIRCAFHGKSGLFTAKGKWLEGELKDANRHLCILVGGRKVESTPKSQACSQTHDPKHTERLRRNPGERPNPRALAAEAIRASLRKVIPSVADTTPDVESTSAVYLTVLPNFHPWDSFNEIDSGTTATITKSASWKS